jgi:hypothetical protein
MSDVETPAAAPAKTEVASRKYIVKSGDTAINLIEYDRDGILLFFDGRKDFVHLTEEELKQLSPASRQNYTMAKEQHVAWQGEEDEDFVKKFVVEGQYGGTAVQKLKGVQSEMAHYWARPDMIADYVAKGWKVASPSLAQTYVKPTAGHISVQKGGVDELVLLVMPKEARKKMLADKGERAKATLVQQVEEVQEESEVLNHRKRVMVGGSTLPK